MKINGIRCNQCGKESYTGSLHVGDHLPQGWFYLQIGLNLLDEHFCSRECLKKRVASDAPLSVPQGPVDTTPRTMSATVGGRIEYE